MLNKLALGSAAIGVAAALSGCVPAVTVKTDSAHDASLAICHTYAFANEHVASLDQPAAYSNPLNAERLRVSIQTNLAAKGIQPVDRAAADCVVGYAMGSRQVFDSYYGGYYGAGWGWGGGWRGGGWGGYGAWGYDGPWVQNETRIAVDVFDAKTHKPIWHASASQNAYDLSGPNAVQKIDIATSAIFAKFPLAVTVPVTGAAAT
jgi:hypothetical protein